MNDSFVFYESYAQGIRTLPPEDQLILMNAVIDYMLYDKEPELSGVVYGMFCLIVPTAKAACKRHKDKQTAANTRWHKEEAEAAQSKAAPPAAKQEQSRPALQEKAEQSQAEDSKVPQGRMYHIGKYHNVFLTQPEYDALQEQFQKEFPEVIDRFSRYKLENKFTLLYDYHALLHYLEHGSIPYGMFDRMEGVIPPYEPKGG